MASPNGTDTPYTPRCILVTGGAGFIASHVVIRLVHQHPEYKIVVLDKMDYCASMNNLASCVGKPNFKCVKGDVQSMDLLAFLLTSEEIDTVMHFAAQVGGARYCEGTVQVRVAEDSSPKRSTQTALQAGTTQVRSPNSFSSCYCRP